MGTAKEELLQKSQDALLIELQRCEQLSIPYLVMHPGSHVGSGEEEGLKRVAESFDLIHSQTPGYKTQILIEITAGQGTNLGYRFEHLAKILDTVQEPERLGVCFDTCHAFAAGYELRTEEGYQATFEAFDNILGLEKLKVIHLNDSLKDLGSRIDRHQGIGRGEIGLDGFRLLMNDSRFEAIPKILETPKDDDPIAADKENLQISAVSGTIHINNNWSATEGAGICTGNGTISEPYVIEDLEINGGGSGTCILIENSDDYFIILNCTVTNSGVNWGDGGIKLSNVDNGHLINNSVSSCGYEGIILDSSHNNSIKGNTANNNP